MIKLNIPFDDNSVRNLRIGDRVLLSGTIFTARDSAHKFLLENDVRSIDFRDHAIYHCGPVVAKDGDSWKIVAAGPTTSTRLSFYEPDFIHTYGIRGIIGKGGMDDKTRAACKEFGCVYFSAVGGAALVLSKSIVKVKAVHYLDKLGMPEAIWELLVNDFPAIVTIDAKGNSLHTAILMQSKKQYDDLLCSK